MHLPYLESVLQTPIQMHKEGSHRLHISGLLLEACGETRCNAGIRCESTRGVLRMESDTRREGMWLLPRKESL